MFREDIANPRAENLDSLRLAFNEQFESDRMTPLLWQVEFQGAGHDGVLHHHLPHQVTNANHANKIKHPMSDCQDGKKGLRPVWMFLATLHVTIDVSV